jgi:hypothetical protein
MHASGLIREQASFSTNRSGELPPGISSPHSLLPHHNRLAIAVAPDQRALARPISPSTEGPLALVRFLTSSARPSAQPSFTSSDSHPFQCRICRAGEPASCIALAPGHTVEAPRSDIHLCVLERLHHRTRSLNNDSISNCEYLVQIALSCGLLLKSRREFWYEVCVCTVLVAKKRGPDSLRASSITP